MPNGTPSTPTKLTMPFVTRGYVLGPKFTLRERLRILFGARVLLSCTSIAQHNPGKTQIVSKVIITPHHDLRAAADAAEAVEQQEVAERQEAIAKITAEAKANAEKGGLN